MMNKQCLARTSTKSQGGVKNKGIKCLLCPYLFAAFTMVRRGRLGVSCQLIESSQAFLLTQGCLVSGFASFTPPSILRQARACPLNTQITASGQAVGNAQSFVTFVYLSFLSCPLEQCDRAACRCIIHSPVQL